MSCATADTCFDIATRKERPPHGTFWRGHNLHASRQRGGSTFGHRLSVVVLAACHANAPTIPTHATVPVPRRAPTSLEYRRRSSLHLAPHDRRCGAKHRPTTNHGEFAPQRGRRLFPRFVLRRIGASVRKREWSTSMPFGGGIVEGTSDPRPARTCRIHCYRKVKFRSLPPVLELRVLRRRRKMRAG